MIVDELGGEGGGGGRRKDEAMSTVDLEFKLRSRSNGIVLNLFFMRPQLEK